MPLPSEFTSSNCIFRKPSVPVNVEPGVRPALTSKAISSPSTLIPLVSRNTPKFVAPPPMFPIPRPMPIK